MPDAAISIRRRRISAENEARCGQFRFRRDFPVGAAPRHRERGEPAFMGTI